jgi:uncharacterized protein YabN with tetrapyrrole methylase and pyrophosphatase domain
VPRSSTQRRNGSLVVVGTGIRVVGHTTLETVDRIKAAEKLYYLVTEPATAAWLQGLNPSAQTLDDLYAAGLPREVTYKRMAARIVSAVGSGQRVCAAFYGHPGVLVNASHRAMRDVRRRGLPAEMLPGISAEDCLFADLGVNPGDNGCQSFEATDFLASRRKFDPTSELVLYQVGAIGEGSVRRGMASRLERMAVLTKALRRHYPARHRVVLYEAATFPVCGPMIKRVRLEQLSKIPVMAMTTLFVPALRQRSLDERIVGWYDEPYPDA